MVRVPTVKPGADGVPGLDHATWHKKFRAEMPVIVRGFASSWSARIDPPAAAPFVAHLPAAVPR